MAQLVVRNLEESVKRRLKAQASRNGRSMEEEAREVLRNAVSAQDHGRRGLGSEIAALFEGIGLEKPIEEIRGWDVRVPDFEE